MIYLIFLKRQIVIFRMNTQEFVEKSRGRRNTGGVNEYQRNLPAYDKSSDAERRNRGCDIAVYRSGKRSLVIRWTLLELFFLFYNPDSDQ